MKLFSNELPLAQKRITAEVCVHHLWFDESSYEKQGSWIKWNPAIKTRFDRDALINAVNNNLIDIIATDHAPHTLEEKNRTAISKHLQEDRLSSIHLLPCLNCGTGKYLHSKKIVEKMCHNPAILFNIKERGFIREGYKADLCLVNPDDPWTYQRKISFINADGHPSKGTTFRSKVVKTIVNGTHSL